VTSKSSEQQPIWTKDFLLITSANLFLFLGFQMLLPVLPVYAASLGGSEASAGLVIGVFTISAVLIRPFAGRWLDQYGRKGVYLLGLSLFVLSIFAYRWTATIPLLLILRFIHGFGWGASSTSTGTIATDKIPKTRMGEGMGFFGLTNSLSMALAPAFGLSIMSNMGFHAVFNYSILFGLIAFIISLFIRYEKPSPKVQAAKPSFFEKTAVFPGAIIFFVAMTYGAVVTFIALYAEQRGIKNIGFFFTVYAIALMISRPFFGRLADHKGHSIAVLPGMVGVLVTMLCLFFAQSLTTYLFAAFIYGLGFGAIQPSLQAMAVDNVPSFRRGAANGTFMTGFDLGIGAGSVISGTIAEITGYQLIYLLALLPATVALLLFLKLNPIRSQKG
jgi:MFS family permease